MSKHEPAAKTDGAERRTFWQPPDKRTVLTEKGKRWQEENAEAIQSINNWVETNGLPLDRYRVR